MYACSVVHVTRICCFELCYLEFSFAYLENSLLQISLISNFQERSWIFRFKSYEKSFVKSTTFHGKFARTKDNFRWILFALLLHNTVICDAYCFQLREFSNDNSLGTKIDFEFSSENSPCSINDLEHLSKIVLFICSAQTFPRIFWTIICLVRICRDDSFLMSLHIVSFRFIQESPVLLQRFPLLFTSRLKHHSSNITGKVLHLGYSL